MPDYYSEPFLNLAGLTHKSALIAWGAFYFRVKNNESDFKLVDDDDLNHVHPPRHQTVGARSEPYGKAKVEVMNLAGNVVASAFTRNSQPLLGVRPRGRYRIYLSRDRQRRRVGQRQPSQLGTSWRQDGIGAEKSGLSESLPHASRSDEAVECTVHVCRHRRFWCGDQKGHRPWTTPNRRGAERAVDEFDVRLILTTGDNIYRTEFHSLATPAVRVTRTMTGTSLTINRIVM